MGDKWQQRDVDRARKMARFSTTCDCTQSWHGHKPGECKDYPTRFSLATHGANAPPDELEKDRVQRIGVSLFVICRNCNHNPKGEGWFQIRKEQR